MAKHFDITGQKFGMWTVLGRGDRVSERAAKWRAQCECGEVREVVKHSLTTGTSKSCGCLVNRRRHSPYTLHGCHRSGIYNSWMSMKQRCFNENHDRFYQYGGRGITVCPRWMTFSNFREDMGDRPAGHSLERIDVNGNYEPGNCIWASAETQANNRRGLKKFLVDGQWRTRKQLVQHWNLSERKVEKLVPAYPMKVIGEEE